MFVHNRKAENLVALIEKRGHFKTFIHKTVRFRVARGKGKEEACPTISGLVFIQGNVSEIQKFFQNNIPQYHLVNDCSTHETAVIPDEVMQPFMRIVEADPVKVRFLLNPISKYAEGNTLVQVMTGPLAGLQGYIIRIDRDRKLVMKVGDMTMAIGGVHKEHFENVEQLGKELKAKEKVSKRDTERRLTEMQGSIDKTIFKPASFSDVLAVAANLGIWQQRATGYAGIGQLDKAIEMLPFILEEIGYYFTNLYLEGKLDLEPIISVGKSVSEQIRNLIVDARMTDEQCQNLETKYEEQIIRHGYMFGVEL